MSCLPSALSAPLRFGFLGLAALAVAGAAPAAAAVTPVGVGSYSLTLPAGAREPQTQIYRTAAFTGKMPTNDWWSSLAWLPYSERQYPHPLAVQAAAAGLRLYYPGPSITANGIGIFGYMPTPAGEDLLLGHSAVGSFPAARVDGASDWFVRAQWASGTARMTLSYGHGSPFVYALHDGGRPRVTFGQAPVVWSGNASTPVLGITTNGRHYGLFGPAGSTWAGLGTASLTNQASAKRYFSVALLPDNTPQTLALFARYAYSHVVDTKVSWRYDPASAAVTTAYAFTTQAYEGSQAGTLFALYPHQWSHTQAPLLGPTYASIRGTMKLAAGTGFTTRMIFPGVLPSLPDRGTYNRATLARYVNEEASLAPPGTRDTYWEGKRLGKVATLAPIAGQAGLPAVQASLTNELKSRLEGWFKATNAQGQLKSAQIFYYNQNWGTLIGYPASYGSDADLNDHHFHYGYYIRAAAEIARRDRAWAAESRWGGMVRLLIRDIANYDRSDTRFPFLRSFDPYAGHSWASGHAKFGDGNNQESSSEAMAAWTGLILWGEATGDRTVRDLGVYLYTTELAGVEEYWFDVLNRNHPAAYTPAAVTLVWGGKGTNETFFSTEPEKIHGINWLPFHGGSLYLGRYPDYVKKNYDALVRETGGRGWGDWAGYVLMYRALQNPADALLQFNARPDSLPIEEGNSRANVYHWLHNLNGMGQVDRTVTADTAVYAVFKKGTVRTHVAYNMGTAARTVRFSDGVTMTVPAGSFGIR